MDKTFVQLSPSASFLLFFFLTAITALSVAIYLLPEEIIKTANKIESVISPKETWTLN